MKAGHIIARAAADMENGERLADRAEEMLDLLRPAVAEHREVLAAAMERLKMRPETTSEDRDY
jgi:hypothetical protein